METLFPLGQLLAAPGAIHSDHAPSPPHQGSTFSSEDQLHPVHIRQTGESMPICRDV
jgi:hypothetical protein